MLMAPLSLSLIDLTMIAPAARVARVATLLNQAMEHTQGTNADLREVFARTGVLAQLQAQFQLRQGNPEQFPQPFAAESFVGRQTPTHHG